MTMKILQYTHQLTTMGREIIDLTAKMAEFVTASQIKMGLCHIFIHHTSASLSICENADPLVLRDLEAFMLRLVPDADPMYQHTEEGPDDMPSHVRTVLTQSFLMLPITDNQLALGRWQGIYLWEHRINPHHRRLTITVQGE